MGTVQIDGSTPKLTIGNATAEDATILFDGNAQDYHVGLDDSADTLVLGLGSTLGTTPAITINSSQVATFAQNPVFPNGSLDLLDLDIDGGTDIGADIVDADLFIVDDGAGGTNRKTTATRIKTYAGFNAATITGTTALAENPQGTDEIILSDAGTLKRLDLKHMMNTPAFFAHGSTATAQSINNNTWTKIANLTTEKLDTDGTFASSAWTPGVAGYYWVNAAVYLGTLDDQEWGQLQFYTNGTDDLSQNGTLYSQNIQQVSSASDNYVATPHLSMVMYLDADDYVEIYARHNEGSAVNADTQFSWFQGFRITTGVLT